MQTWQPPVDRLFEDDDARQSVENVTSFFRILAEWDRAADPSSPSLETLPRPKIVSSASVTTESTAKRRR